MDQKESREREREKRFEVTLAPWKRVKEKVFP